MKDENIFDLSDLSDLPAAVSLNVSEKNKKQSNDENSNQKEKTMTKMVLDLFHDDLTLELDEIMVGVYRVNKKIVSKVQLNGIVQPLIMTGRLERVSKGFYQISEKSKNK